MSSTIKGITIEIGGNTQPLNKALGEVNKKTKDIQSELKQVERLLKLDPKNTELLAQKQKLLADAISASSEKLNTLREAERQAQEQFRQGKISEEQYRALQREIIKAEQDLRGLDRQLNEITDTTRTWQEQLNRTAEGLKKVGQKMTDIGKDLSMKVTAPIAAMGAVVTKTGMDFEAAMSQVGAISGATGKDIEALEAKAKEMGSTTKFSASQSAEALKYMAMAGWDTTKMLDGLSGVMNLAAASGEELGVVSDIVTDAMTAFGMEASRAGEFADVLAVASSKSNTNVAMLGESFKYVAPVAGALGYTSQDTAVALGLMANAGIKASQSGTSLRSTITRLAKPTKQAQDAIDFLGLSLTDSTGNMKSLHEVMGDIRKGFGGLTQEQQAFYAAELAGQEGMSGLLAIVGASEEDFNSFSNAINNADGTAKKMADTMQDNLSGRLTILKSALEGVAIQLYDAMQPALEKLVAIMQKATEAFAGLSPGTQAAIIGIAGIAAAIGPVLIALGLMAQGIGAIIALGPIIASAGATIGAAFTAMLGPVGLAIAAVGVLIATGVMLYKNWDTLEAKASKIWEGIKTTFKNNIAALGSGWETLKAGLAAVGSFFSDTWQDIKTKTAKIWEDLKNEALSWGQDIIQGLINGIKNKIESVKTAAGDIAETIKTKIKSALNISSPSKVMEQFGGYVSEGLAEGIKNKKSAVEAQTEQLARVITDAGRKMLDDLGRSTELSTAKFGLAREKLGKNADEIERLKIDLQALEQGLTDSAVKIDILAAAYETSRKKLGDNSEATRDYAQQLQLAKIEHEKLQASIQNNIFEQEAAAVEKANKALEKMQSAYDDIVSAAAGAADQQEDELKDVYDQAKETYDGIVERANKAYDEIIEAAEKARDQKVSAYQKELDAIDEAETKRDRESTRTKLQNKIKSARTAKDKAEAENEWDEWLHDEQIRIQKEGIQDKIDVANQTYEDTKTAAEKERDRQIAAAEDQLKIEEGKYNEGLRLAKQHYKNTLTEAQNYYKTLGYSIDEVTGKLTQQTAAAQAASAAMSGGQSGINPSGNQGTNTPTGTTTPTNPGTTTPTNPTDTWRPSVGTALRYESIPGVTITPSSDGSNWYFKFSSEKGTWNRLASTIPGTSLVNGSYTITDSNAFYNFIKDLIPGYAAGTGGHPGGPALIDEKENELVIEPGKKPYRYKEKGPKYVNLPKGTQVIPAYEEGTPTYKEEYPESFVDRWEGCQTDYNIKQGYFWLGWNPDPSSADNWTNEYYWTDTGGFVGYKAPTTEETNEHLGKVVDKGILQGTPIYYQAKAGNLTNFVNMGRDPLWSSSAFNLSKGNISEWYWTDTGDFFGNSQPTDEERIAHYNPSQDISSGETAPDSSDTVTPTPDTSQTTGNLIGDIESQLSGTLQKLDETMETTRAQIKASGLEAEINNPDDERAKLQETVTSANAELDDATKRLDAVNTAIKQAKESYGEGSEEVAQFTHQQEMATIAVQSANANLRIAQRDLKNYDEQTGQWSDDLETANRYLTGINSSLEKANDLYTAAKKAVDNANDALSGYQNKLSEYSQTDITGTRAYTTAQHERSQKTAALDLQILEEETNKTKGYRKRIKALEKEKEKIEIENQKAALEYELSIGDQQWQLRQLLSDTKEMNFNELTSAISQTRQQIAITQSTLATAKTALITAENNVSFWQGLQEKQQGLITVLGTVYDTLAGKVAAFTTALNAVAMAGLMIPATTPINSLLKLPMAANGAIATRPTLGIWGDAGDEALIPLNKLPDLIMDSLSLAIEQRNGGYPIAQQGAGEMNMNFVFSGPINIRNDNDIKQVSREIFNLAQNAWRSKGVR
ncbi:MAG: phage tail tape measure protein [Syntrophomonadaceae bacterium]|nr:phage tail tape measure protein [Syntrophomonadaceae bacterium]